MNKNNKKTRDKLLKTIIAVVIAILIILIIIILDVLLTSDKKESLGTFETKTSKVVKSSSPSNVEWEDPLIWEDPFKEKTKKYKTQAYTTVSE